VIETEAQDEIEPRDVDGREEIDLLRSWAFVLVHLGAVGALFTGISTAAVVAGLVTYWVRLFGITGGYHRYFSHRTYETSRAFRFVLAWLGASAAQNGPLWWVSHHRLHHRHADTEDDIHPPGIKGFWWAHAGWILCRKYKGYDSSVVRDLADAPELRLLGRYHLVAPVSLAALLFGLGWWLESRHPGLGTGPWQMVGWGFFVSTVALYHTTFLVNSVAHTVGRRRFGTDDESRNNWLVALLTLGEGWHNNHHRWPTSERQGFFWWEVDVTHYVLRVLAWMGLVWDLREPPEKIYAEAEGSEA
jgi:stearoyl-CoA desaturase (delta-9 desaturase)